ncbi:MAG: hypothetical protein WC989_07795 [Micavibrio sp.]
MRLHFLMGFLAFIIAATGIQLAHANNIPDSSGLLPFKVKTTSMNLAIGGLWNAYAPETITYMGKERMWIGGWRTHAEQGNDLIYYSELNKGTWSQPTLAFKRADYAVNDPTVIQHPVNKDWLFMYFTALHKVNHNVENMTSTNIVGFASSIDGGKTWTDHGNVINQNNGYNTHGAWAPAAILSPDKREIWVYYHTNSPSNILLRTRFNINGWQQVGKTQPVRFSGEARQNGRLNIDVAHYGNSFHLVANDGSLHDIGYYTSRDGLNFLRRGNITNPIIKGGPHWLLTPHIRVVSDRVLQLYFGFAPNNSPCSKSWHGINFLINCGDSIHHWTLEVQ